MTELSTKLIAWQWLNAFAPTISKSELKKHVIGDGNFLWHIFSWEFVSCVKQDDARHAFDSLEYDRAILFRSGYSFGGLVETSDLSFVDKLRSTDLDRDRDVYIVAPDFSWTYVHTHERSCGPYFCRRKD